MAATVVVCVFHGTIPTAFPLNTISNVGVVDTLNNIRFKEADNSTKDLDNPIRIPLFGSNYSYRKHTMLQFLTAPPNQITNLVWYSNGVVISTGVSVHVGLNSTYYQGGTNNDNGQTDIIDSGGTPDVGISSALLTQQESDAVNFVHDQPLGITAGVVVATVDNPTYPCFASSSGSQKYVVQQMQVQAIASSGSTPDFNYSYEYDEQ